MNHSVISVTEFGTEAQFKKIKEVLDDKIQ